MYTIFVNSKIEPCREVGKIDTPKIAKKSALGKKTFQYLDLRISKNILQIGEAKVSKFKFMHSLSELKSIFAIEQKAIVSCFVKNIAFLLGHPLFGPDHFCQCPT